MAEVILEMKNITKTFPGVKALDNVNLKVEKGEIPIVFGMALAMNPEAMKKFSDLTVWETLKRQ